MSGTHIAFLGEGSLLGFPIAVSLEKGPDGVAFTGVLRLKDAGLHQLLDYTGSDLARRAGEHVRDMLGTVSGEIAVRYGGGMKSLVYSGDILFAAVGTAGGSAVLFRYVYTPGKSKSGLMQAIESVVKALGVTDFFLFFRTGGGISASAAAKLLPGSPMRELDELKKLNLYDIIVRGHFDMRQSDSAFTGFMKSLFKLDTLDLFIAATRDGSSFETFLLLPSFDSGIVSGRELTIGCGLQGGVPSFSMSGTFAFSFLPGMSFTVDCMLGAAVIRLTAFAHSDKPLPLIGPFKIGDTALLIGYENSGLTFGLLSTLYIGQLALFGGVIIQYTPPAEIVPLLLVLAVQELSLPLLIRNLCETDFAGLNFLDFIKILGFELNLAKNFPAKVVQKADVPALINHFNTQVAAKELHLKEGRVEIQRYGDGLAFIDQERMRCYYIEKDGKLKLQAQIYYSTVPTPIQMGPYSISGGIFLCGVIEIFKVKIKILFSFVKGSGVLAFAQLDRITLGGFLSLTAAKRQIGADGTTIPLPANSVMQQFMDKTNSNGLLFFLQANKQNQTFYFSACLKLFSLFEVDALLKYESGDIAINASFDIAVFTVTLGLRVKYLDFQNGGFAFKFVLDTSKLEKALKKVSQCIEGAIARVQQSVDSAIRRINDAQSRVWQLYSQIDDLNRRINDCRAAIRKAKWYQFWIPIGKGVEIAAYEIAKLGIYTAIGVATVALEVAKACVKMGGMIASGTLHLVNGIVKAVTSIFFIKRIELEAHASTSNQKFKASISFVALGKEYTYSADFAMGSFGADALSDNMNAKMEPDLKNLDSGSFKSNFSRFDSENLPLSEQLEVITQSIEQIRAARSLLNTSCNAYIHEFHELPADYEETNLSFVNSLKDAQASFETIRRFKTQTELEELVRQLGQDSEVRSRAPREIQDMETKLRQLDEIYAAVHDTMPKLDDVMNGIHRNMKTKQEQAAKLHCEHLAACEPVEGDMLRVIDKVEAAVEKHFPYNNANVARYMNMSREPLLWQGLLAAREYYGGDVSQSRAAYMLKKTNRRSGYEPRL